MILHEITQTSAFYKVLSIVAHKNVFISSWTTSWKQSLTDCFYRKIASRGNTSHQTERHENVLPLSTGNWAPLQLRSQRCPFCWMSPQLWASLGDTKMQVATACFWSYIEYHQRRLEVLIGLDFLVCQLFMWTKFMLATMRSNIIVYHYRAVLTGRLKCLP